MRLRQGTTAGGRGDRHDFDRADLDGARAAAATYLGHLEAGDEAAAYRMLCPGVRRELTLAGFTVAGEAGPWPSSHVITGARPSTEVGVEARVTDPVEAVRAIDLDMAEHDDAWELCGRDVI